MQFPVFPMRQIHLDFHTSPAIPDVGADWDADVFIDQLKEARVNSITIFAKCHHGMNYYPTKIGTIHPSLKFDLMGEQIEACHRAGIRCPIYVSIGFDEAMAEVHPEWRQVDINGKLVGRTPLEPGWAWMCVGTDYAEQLYAQTEELMANYDCDGFFYDILMYHPDGSLNPPALKSLTALGLDPRNPDDRRRHNHILARRFMDKSTKIIRDKMPDIGVFYNSRWGLHFQDESQYYAQVEIESLPTGGWGYAFYPMWSRYGRQFDLPMLGMTGRFHRTWADWGGLKHPDALKFECGGILATGGAVSIGDQLHPRGRLNRAVYDVIGEAFREVEAVEEYCFDAKPVVDTAILVLQPDGDKANMASAGMVNKSSEGVEGAAKILLENHAQFDIITPKVCPDFSRYKLLVLADKAVAEEEIVGRLKDFVAGGGKLFLSHEALINEGDGGNFALADEIRADYIGPAESNPDYFQLTDSALFGPVTRENFPYCLYDGPASRVRPRPGTEILADVYPTYFNRTWEHFTSHGLTCPTETKADYPALIRNGNVLYFYGPLFSAYIHHGNLTFRALAGKCLDLLLTEKILETDAPPSCEVTVMRQTTQTGDRHIVHLVNYSPQRRASGHVEVLDAPTPLHNVTVKLRRPGGAKSAFIARTKEALPVTIEGDYVKVVVPRVETHTMVVFD